MRRLCILLLLLVVVVAVEASPAGACSCARLSDEEAFARADAVFVGSLADRKVQDGSIFTSDASAVHRFDVSAVYKGEVRRDQEIVSHASGSTCGFASPPSGDVLVFANEEAWAEPQPGPGQFAGDLCNGTRPLGQGGIPPAFGRPIEPVAVSSQAPGGLVRDGADDRRRLFIVSVGVLALTGVASGVFMCRRRATD